LQASPGLAGATIMMLCASSTPADRLRCRDLGVDAFVTKPVKPSQLLDTIQQIFNRNILETRAKSAISAAQDECPSLPARRLTVLVAEDNAVNQKLAAIMLQKLGHESVIVANGRQAIEALDRQQFDVILMDVQMPEMDGFAATAAIRQREAQTGGHIPIIAMTAHAMKGDREKCLEAGMDGYVSKPVRSRELVAALSNVALANSEAYDLQGPEVQRTARPQNAKLIFDPAEILDRVGGDLSLLAQLIALFNETATPMVAEIRSAIADADGVRLGRAAHKLRGSVSVFAAASIVQILQSLDEIARTGDFSAASATTEQLESQLARLAPALNSMIQENTYENSDCRG
jgi:two-component system sensor histidine kinase/response regulator